MSQSSSPSKPTSGVPNSHPNPLEAEDAARNIWPSPSLCRSKERGIAEGCNGIERVETLWCGGDPVWGSEDVENPALGSVPCPQAVLVLWIPEEQVYEGKNQKRGTHSQWGP